MLTASGVERNPIGSAGVPLSYEQSMTILTQLSDREWTPITLLKVLGLGRRRQELV